MGFPSGLFVVALLTFVRPSPAWAQAAGPSFGDLLSKVKSGQALIVVDADGHEFEGHLAAISASELRLLMDGLPQPFAPSQVRAVGIVSRRPGWIRPTIDGVFGGAIGLTASYVVGFLRDCDGCKSDGATQFRVATTFIGIGIGAGLGAAIDAMHGHTRWIYDAPPKSGPMTFTIAPIVTPARKSLALVIRF